MIDYARDLNPAQLEAVQTLDGPVLVIAGAGSGKTRTIVYRLARLVESGVPPASILLLTFTRKAAQEMLHRARLLLAGSGGGQTALAAVQGGTFHAYAYSVLRRFRPEGYGGALTVMDGHDILAALQHCREELKLGRGDRSFPKNQTINAMLSKSRNKERPLEEVVGRDSPHLLPHAEGMLRMAGAYEVYKREKNLLDYDDLLFRFEETLLANPAALEFCRSRYRHIMVDEYQDSNPVQARIAALTAGRDPAPAKDGGPAGGPGGEAAPFTGNIMAVGDDAQSIYAFRGADVRNILGFPEIFPGAKLIRLEENYRSTQPLLDFSNAVLERAAEGFGKRLFTRRGGGEKPNMIRPMSDRSQASLVAARIQELLPLYGLGGVAVLFRAGFHSYALEVALNKLGLPFRKYGGIRYTEAAHIKDAMSFARLVLNPLDHTAFSRMAALSRGVGPKTALKIYGLLAAGDGAGLKKALAKHASLAADLEFIESQRCLGPKPAPLLSAVVEHYGPRLEELFPDDHPRRLQGLEQLVQIASAYDELDLLVADLSLEDPAAEEEAGPEAVTLSTVHSAKGLEWDAVLVIDLVEDRFPSRHAMSRPEDYEEERRLMYVACTRARVSLDLYVPASVYDRSSGGGIPAVPSPFVRDLTPDLYTEWQEGYTGALRRKEHAARGAGVRAGQGAVPRFSPGAGGAGRGIMQAPVPGPDDEADAGAHENPAFGGDAFPASAAPPDAAVPPAAPPSACGFCRHRIFGRGKIVQHLPPDKVRVNFPGIGLKVIMAAYLTMED